MPSNSDEWVDKLNELLNGLDQDTFSEAYSGNAKAKAVVEAWAIEMQAAILFAATYMETASLDVEAFLEMINIIIDTVQAILIALGIVYLLKRLKKSEKSTPMEVHITLDAYKSSLGNKTKPIPSRDDRSNDEEAMFLYLRATWTTHYLITLLKGLEMNRGGEGSELIWKAHLDEKTCSICRFMHNKKSVGGDFLPTILKNFPAYKAYVNWMGFPHAHPRCRCIAVPA